MTTSSANAVLFDSTNPDPWLDDVVRRTSNLPELARCGSVHVLRAVLNENEYVKPDGSIPPDAAPTDWVLWHVARGRVGADELDHPGVLLVHEALAAAAEEETFVALTLKARAWRDSGYDPEGLFRASRPETHFEGT